MKIFNMKTIQFVLLLVILFASAVFLLDAKDSNMIVARAAVLQGAAATALLFATWMSINRTDEQIGISNRILNLEYEHHIQFDLDGNNFIIVNLSRMPIYLSDVRYEIETLRIVNFSVANKIVIEPGKAEVVLLEGLYEPQDIAEELQFSQMIDPDWLQRKLDEEWQKRYIHVSYLYAGTSNKRYTKLFEIRPQAVPWRSEEPINWMPILVPMEDYNTPLIEKSNII